MSRQRVSVAPDAKMVTNLAKLVREPAMLYGWVPQQVGNIVWVTLDDGREFLVARADLTKVTEWSGWDESAMAGAP